MEVSAIVNSPAQQQKQVKRNGVLRAAIGGAGIGAVINGVTNFAGQKSLLKHGDAYLKNMTEVIENTAEPTVKEAYTKIAEELQTFLKNGKVDMKQLGKNALRGAVTFGIFFAGFELISNAIKNHKAKKASKQV